MYKDKILYPKFSLIYQLLLILLIILFLGYFFTQYKLLLDTLENAIKVPMFVSQSLIVLILLFVRFIQYKSTTFSILDNAVQYKFNFFMLSQKRLRYKDIKEITLHRNVFQKIFGLGTVKVTSHATTRSAGIKLYDLENYQEVYDLLMEKIDY